jgi:O-antigen/teichoic acid export membrane protein
LLGLSIIVGDQLATVTDAPQLESVAWLLAIGVGVTGIFQASLMWGVRKAGFGKIGTVRIIQPAGQVGGELALGVAGLPTGMLFGDLAGRILGAIAMAVRTGAAGAVRALEPARTRAMSRRYRRFPLISTWSGLANAAGLHLTPFLVATSFGPDTAALFAIGQRVMGLPATVFGQAVADVYVHQAAEARRELPARLSVLFAKTMRRLVVLGAIFFLPAFLVAPAFFELVFGPAYREAGELMRAATPFFYAQFVVAPLSQTLYVMERQEVQLAWDVLRLAAGLLVFAAAAWGDWGAERTMVSYGAAMALAYVALAVLSYSAVAGAKTRTGGDS